MATHAVYEHWRVRNRAASSAAATQVAGWRLEGGIFLRRLKFLVGCLVQGDTALKLRCGIGMNEPTTMAGVEALENQFIGGPADAESTELVLPGTALVIGSQISSFDIFLGHRASPGERLVLAAWSNNTTFWFAALEAMDER